MTQVGKNSLDTRASMTVGGKTYAYYSLARAAEKIGDVSRLPFSMKVLLGAGMIVGACWIAAPKKPPEQTAA